MSKKTKKIEIIFENEHLLVINKPSGISVTHDRSGAIDIRTALAEQLKLNDPKDLRLIHRLDKLTSGVMLLAKTRQAQSKYSSMFEKRIIKKSYLAIVQGFAADDNGTIKTPLAHYRKQPGTVITDPKRGKPAITEWTILADFGLVSLVEARPVTGRTHQVRVHLKSIGMPLAIDPLYGSETPIMLSDFKKKYKPKPGMIEKPLIDRLTLHAYSIFIPETELNDSMQIVAPLDKQYRAAVKMLAKHNQLGEKAFNDPKVFDLIVNSKPVTDFGAATII